MVRASGWAAAVPRREGHQINGAGIPTLFMDQ